MKKWLGLIGCVLLVGIVSMTVWKYRGGAESPEELLEDAKLTICFIGAEPTDMDMVLEKLNELTRRELNCTVEIEWIGWGEFASRYPILLSTDEKIDLIYAANWLDFYENAERGAFAPLDELVAKYAPESNEMLTLAERNQVTVNGHLYALPANYTNYNLLGVIARGDLMDKYHIPPIESFEDYLSFCDVIAGEEGMDPTGMCSMNMDFFTLYVMSEGYYPVTGSSRSPYWVQLNDEQFRVYFQSECPGIEQYLSQAKDWYQKGYWSDHVLASKDETMLDSGLAASRIHNYDAYLGEYGLNLDKDLRYYNLTSPVVRQTALQDAMAIPALSANKERAMMLLEKLRNDEAYYMLLTYGIEGYHYTTNGRQIKFLNKDYGNEPGTWGFRDKRYKCWDSILPEDALDMSAQFEVQSVDTPLVNFSLDLGPIQTEYAAIREVMENYYDPLKLGYIDYESGVEELNRQLEAAGNETVKLEIQRQIVEFMKQQNS
ncbi:MAG: ABC transporter substrate-binding protein [Lachnospiraceae bacterium]|nr:ABC transporter substrate-binding protein [Lachnospiraceae bacterium]